MIAQGAEAKLWKENGILTKERFAKGYRLKKLDALLRKQRTVHEAELLNDARRAGVCTPHIIEIGETELKMEWLSGTRIKELMNRENCERLGKSIGEAIGKLHTFDMIHGDLTTSNMIMHGDDVCFIDFGLGFHSSKTEDKAVDLYLLYHAVESTHWELLESVWNAVLDGYKQRFAQADKVIKTLDAIEKRGRYKKH